MVRTLSDRRVGPINNTNINQRNGKNQMELIENNMHYQPMHMPTQSESPSWLSFWSGVLVLFGLIVILAGALVGGYIVTHTSDSTIKAIGMGVVIAPWFSAAFFFWLSSVGNVLSDMEKRQRRYQP